MVDKPVSTVGGSPSAEKKSLRKAEKKKRKQDRKEKRRAGRQTGDIREVAHASGSTSARAVFKAASNSATIHDEGLKMKSGRAYHSPGSARVSPQSSKTASEIPDSEDEGSGNDKAAPKQTSVATLSPESPTKNFITTARSTADQLRNPTNSLSAMSISEYDNNVVMSDYRSESADDIASSPQTSLQGNQKKLEGIRKSPSIAQMGTSFIALANLRSSDAIYHSERTSADLFERNYPSKPGSDTDTDDDDDDEEVERLSMIDTSHPREYSNSRNEAKIGDLQWPSLPDSDSDEDDSTREAITTQGARKISFQERLQSSSDSETSGREIVITEGTKDTYQRVAGQMVGFARLPDTAPDTESGFEDNVNTQGAEASENEVEIEENDDHDMSDLDSDEDEEGSIEETIISRGAGASESEVENGLNSSDVDSDEEGSVEETIISRGAKAVTSRFIAISPETHVQAFSKSVSPNQSGVEEGSDEEETLDEDEMSVEGETSEEEMSHEASPPARRELLRIMPVRHAGFPPLEKIPSWFPTKIKKLYRVDRHGGALSFKELNAITRYRGALEKIRRQKWKTYLEAGEARFKLQKAIRRLRISPRTKAFDQYRKGQYRFWKKEAMKSWKRLEKTHLGIRVLDETIDINVRQEGMIYQNIDKKSLGRRL